MTLTMRVKMRLTNFVSFWYIYNFSFLLFISVCPDTELTIYNDCFFAAQDVVVNALDNVEARRYVDR